jgi:hypothetical protein
VLVALGDTLHIQRPLELKLLLAGRLEDWHFGGRLEDVPFVFDGHAIEDIVAGKNVHICLKERVPFSK